VEAPGLNGVECSAVQCIRTAAVIQSRQAERVLAMHALACQAVPIVVELGGGGLAHARDLCRHVVTATLTADVDQGIGMPCSCG
jgi:hypothetical protein